MNGALAGTGQGLFLNEPRLGRGIELRRGRQTVLPAAEVSAPARPVAEAPDP